MEFHQETTHPNTHPYTYHNTYSQSLANKWAADEFPKHIQNIKYNLLIPPTPCNDRKVLVFGACDHGSSRSGVREP